MQHNYDLDTPLFQLAGEDAKSAFTIRNACESILILGNTGSGKTSGSGSFVSQKYLKQGFGGLVLTVKADEVDTWREYCKSAGREDDLIVVDAKGKHYFNFLEYESTVKSALSYAQNILQLLKVVIKSGEERSGNDNKDAFWENAMELFMLNLINISLLAYSKVNVQLLNDIAQSAPKIKTTPKETGEDSAYTKAMTMTKANLRKKVDEWKAASGYTAEFIESLSEEEYSAMASDAIPEYRTLENVMQFFDEGLYRISDKTRSIIDFSLMAFLQRLLHDPIYTLFCNKPSTFTPESCLDGKIVVINLPVKIYDKVGQDAQTLIKYVFQRAWERRNLEENDRPVFLWVDEAQFLLHSHDTIFQTTARSSRIAVVYLTQNLPGFYANMSGDDKKSEYKVKSFLATLSTKIFHANNDVDTNEYASALIGQAYTEDLSSSVNLGEKFSITEGSAYSLEHIVRPETFSKLATGGPQHNRIVEAYIHCQGKTFKNKCNHRKIQFHQKQTNP